MRDVKKVILVVLVLSLLLVGLAAASMPGQKGIGYPRTVWSDKVKGTVSGKVVTSMDQAKGFQGAYVAIVDTMNPGKEYANTTTDADGNYRFTNVNATYSSTLNKGPDGTSGSYSPDRINVYMIYANVTSGEGYSNSFGIDTNHTNKVMDTIVVYTGTPNPDDFATATPEPSPQPTAVVTPVPATPTPEPTPVPAGQFPIGQLLTWAAIAIAILAIFAIAAYYLFLRKK
jgi:hypothetical protein